MSIVKRGKDKWQVRIFLGRDANGKMKFHNETVEGRRKDAETLETKRKREVDTGVLIEHSNLTVDEYLDQWLKVAAKPRLRSRTYDDYKDLLRRYVRPAFGRRHLSKLKPLAIQELYTSMLARSLSPRTVRYTHAILSSSLKQAVKWQMLPSNPASMVDLPQSRRNEMKALSVEECTDFLSAAATDEHYPIFLLAIETGMRPEEYLGLQWKDIDFSRRTIRVQRALVWNRKGGGWNFEEPKTAKSRRMVPISAPIIEALSHHRKKQLEERLKLGPDYQNHDLVFATQVGSPILTSNLTRRHFKPLLKKAGLQLNYRLYDLRHTCATLLLQAEKSPKVVAERLGHSTVVLTLDTYSHVLPTMQKDATDVLERMLYGQAK
jgi:integrase